MRSVVQTHRPVLLVILLFPCPVQLMTIDTRETYYWNILTDEVMLRRSVRCGSSIMLAVAVVWRASILLLGCMLSQFFQKLI